MERNGEDSGAARGSARGSEPAKDGEAGTEGERRPGRPPSRLLDSALHSDALPERARCPFCGERDTEQFAAFGSAVSTSQYYCRRCRTVFEFMKRRRRG